MDSLIRLAIQKGLLNEVTVRALEEELEAQTTVTVLDPSRGQSEKETLIEPGNTAQLASRQAAQEFKHFGRYEVIRLLGEGGMGSVYQALDPMLNRYIALKFIRGDNPQLVERLLREGRAQAKIEHPNVCKVYEVGQINGRFFIAMQYLSGKSLPEASKEMTLEQKLKVMVLVAEALHTAHKEGLIHRDIKPQNIMVEQNEDGSWKPYIMDFGLVKELTVAGITVLGKMLGTPSYMPPEQAMQAFGEESQLDRRADVYSLGVTLYELLSGQLPFGEGTSMEVLARVVGVEPVPLRKLAPKIPLDLNTIVMKCIEKEPQQRYDSAKALAEDLQRYLDGEPIAGQPVSWFYRLAKKLRKNKAVAALIAVTILVGLGLAGIGLHARWQAAARAELARQFGEQVKEIESIMRYGHLLPLHDLGREENIVRLQLQKVSVTMRGLGAMGEGPGSYALGRGYAALQEYEQARQHLQAAWDKGYQDPRVAYTLGLVLDELYQRRLEEIDQIQSKELRELQRHDAEEKLKQPAIRYLSIGRDATGEAAEYGEALIAFSDRRWDEALQKASAAIAKAPWQYEAKALMANVHAAIAAQKSDKGDYQGAKAAYQAADSAYQDALKLAASDPKIYEYLCRMWISVLIMNLYTGDDNREAFERLTATCDQGLAVSPNSAAWRVFKAEGHVWLGRANSRRGEDPLADYAKAIEQAEQVLADKDASLRAFMAIGTACHGEGSYKKDHGQDPLPAFDRGIESYRHALALNHNYVEAYKWMADILSLKGNYLKEHGQDPLAAYDQSIETYRRALEINPKLASAYNNIGIAYQWKGEYQQERGEDYKKAFDQAIESYRQALQINPNFSFAYSGLANVYMSIGLYQLYHGEDPTAAYDQAIESNQQALKINPKLEVCYNNTVYIYSNKAKYRLMLGEDPTPECDQGIEFINKEFEINPNNYYSYTNLSYIYLAQLQQNLRRGQDPAAPLKRLLAALKKAQEINSADYEAYQVEAKANILQARWELEHKRSPNNSLVSAITALKKSLVLKPDEAESYRVLAECYRWQGAWRPTKAQNELTQGLELVEKALAYKADFADAYLTKGALKLLQAATAKEGIRRTEAAQAACQALQQALSINRFLEKECRPLLDEAQKWH